jgi:hypothetical protein
MRADVRVLMRDTTVATRLYVQLRKQLKEELCTCVDTALCPLDEQAARKPKHGTGYEKEKRVHGQTTSTRACLSEASQLSAIIEVSPFSLHESVAHSLDVFFSVPSTLKFDVGLPRLLKPFDVFRGERAMLPEKP